MSNPLFAALGGNMAGGGGCTGYKFKRIYQAVCKRKTESEVTQRRGNPAAFRLNVIPRY